MKMTVRLLSPSIDPVFKNAPDSKWDDRFSDLEMEHILNIMSRDSEELSDICRQVMDLSLSSSDEIIYRQDILKDFLAQPEVARKIYQTCLDARENKRGIWLNLSSPYLSTIYSSAAHLLKIYMEALVKIRKILEEHTFTSAGLRRFSATLSEELSDEYLDQLRDLEDGIAEKNGILISSGFGSFLQGVSYVKLQKEKGLSRLQWLVHPSYTIAEQDTTGSKDLEFRRDRAINEVANAMAQAADNLENFTNTLRMELGFYVGALNLHDQFQQFFLPVCFPSFSTSSSRSWENLYDGSLALLKGGPVVGNSLEIVDTMHCLITGANQGGKTTFLRSVGQCQLMAQCGLFVCADRCTIPVNTSIYTHFKREEDSKMDSGKLDEELERMSKIIDGLSSGSLLLSNESFSSTNDVDGSKILGQITQALLEKNIEVFTVTHLINYAMTYSENQNTLCLRAERMPDGTRTFKLVVGKPLKTAFGEDIFQKIFHPKES